MNPLGLFLLVVILGLVIYLVYNSSRLATSPQQQNQGCNSCGPRLPSGPCNPCNRCRRCRPCGCVLNQ